MTTLSAKFIAAVAQSPAPRYQLCARVAVSPSWLSVVMRPHKTWFSPKDRERLRDLAAILGLKAEDIFEE
jgi:hypothetical protein